MYIEPYREAQIEIPNEALAASNAQAVLAYKTSINTTPFSPRSTISKRVFEKSCQCQARRMRYRLHPSCPEAGVSTFSTNLT